jgi:uracil-DNA glycosylase
MSDKQTRYSDLVNRRKQCRICPNVTNQSSIDGGEYDKHDSIGAWSLWHGDLDAEVFLVGQDWGSVANYKKTQGYPTSSLSIGMSKTNRNLISLISILGYTVCEFDGVTKKNCKLFFTNGLLCLNSEDKENTKIHQPSMNRCIACYLKELIDIIKPKVVISLAVPTYKAIKKLYGITAPDSLKALLDSNLPCYIGKIRYYPVIHCGGLGLANRSFDLQRRDWGGIRDYLKGLSA